VNHTFTCNVGDGTATPTFSGALWRIFATGPNANASKRRELEQQRHQHRDAGWVGTNCAGQRGQLQRAQFGENHR